MPVFANGDVIDVDSAIKCLEESKADGIAAARGVLGNPALLDEIENYLKTGEKPKNTGFKEKIRLMKTHLDEEIRLRGENCAIQFTRKFYPYYIRG